MRLKSKQTIRTWNTSNNPKSLQDDKPDRYKFFKISGSNLAIF